MPNQRLQARNRVALVAETQLVRHLGQAAAWVGQVLAGQLAAGVVQKLLKTHRLCLQPALQGAVGQVRACRHVLPAGFTQVQHA